MPTLTDDKTRARARRELSAIGARRRALDGQKEGLQGDTERVLKRWRGTVPLAEAARLVGLNRSTIYELYLGESDDEGSETAARDEQP